MSRLPVGTVTFLLTDVEGSTRLWETAPSVAGTMIARHYELLDDAISTWGGVRPQEQGEGDSVVAVFDDPVAAVRAAIEAQRAIEAEPWPEGQRLRVRMALHSGGAVKRGDDNYVGPAIIRCARLRACGHGGQILLSDTTAALVRGELGDGVTAASLGVHRLKDVDAAEHVHQLVASGLPASFPPLRSFQADRHNLPLQVTSLIGRDDDIMRLCDLMNGSRVVTLTGSGGVGKTRLALRVAAESIDRFHGGVWWVDLAVINDPNGIAGAVLHAIGGAQQPHTAPLEQLVVVLKAETSILILLDNCEHLVGGCAALVNRVIAACPGVTFLATSREPLGVAGETTWRVASLAVPDTDDGADPVRHSALELFIDRASRVRPQLRSTPAVIEACARICRRVDGIPLAIELAAARCRQFSPERIASELEDRYRLLTGGGNTQLARQRTLEASVDWSHTLLSDAERLAFRRLSVFVGWFPLAAAEGVLASVGDIDPWEVMDLVGRLVDKSLLVVDDEPEPNYRMLETVRFYALQRADDADELEYLRHAHADWWSNWLTDANDPIWVTSIVHQLDRWYPNVWAAFNWVAADLDRAIPFVVGLATYTSARDRVDHYKSLQAVALNLHKTGHARWREVAGKLSIAAVARGELEFLLGPVTEAYEGAIAAGDDENAAECLFGLGLLDFAGTRFTEMAERGERAHRDDLMESALAFYLWLDPLPLDTKTDQATLLERRTAPKDHNLHLINVISVVEAAIARGHFDNARNVCTQMLERIDSEAVTVPSSHLSILAKSALADLFCVEPRTLRDVLRRRDARIFRGVPSYWSGILFASIDISGHHLLGTELDASEVAAALTSTMSDIGSIAVRTIVAELLDRQIVEPVRGALERFRQVPYAEDAFRHLVHDWFGAQLAAAEGNYDAADNALRDILPRAQQQGAVPMVIDALELLSRLCGPSAARRAGRLVHASDAARAEIEYRFRFPNHAHALEEIPRPSDEAPMSLDHAVAYALRTHGRRGRPTVGWASLTPTELDVARLVAEGATNPAIAEKLTMTVNTVKTHLAHIFTKLDITSRAQLASLVTQQRSS